MPKPVVFAGSFDPVTNGHVEIIRRAQSIFGSVVVLVMPNAQKTPLFSLQERKALLEEVFKKDKHIKVASATGLLVNYMKKHHLTVLVRGIRNGADLSYENTARAYNQWLYPSLETVYLPATEKFAFVSSSLVKESFSYGADVRPLLPASVFSALKRKLIH